MCAHRTEMHSLAVNMENVITELKQDKHTHIDLATQRTYPIQLNNLRNTRIISFKASYLIYSNGKC